MLFGFCTAKGDLNVGRQWPPTCFPLINIIGSHFFYKLKRKITFTKEIYLFIYSLILNVYSLYSTSSNTNSMQMKHHNKACTSKASHIIIFPAVFFFWFTACISKASHIIICQILILFLTDRKLVSLFFFKKKTILLML